MRPHNRGWLISGLSQTVKWMRMLTFAAVLLTIALKTDVTLPAADLAITLRTNLSWGNYGAEVS